LVNPKKLEWERERQRRLELIPGEIERCYRQHVPKQLQELYPRRRRRVTAIGR
jgi:hypothetical protein